MMKPSIKIKLNLEKILFAVSVLYTNVFAYRFFQIPGLSALLIYGTLLLVFLQNRSLVFQMIRFEKAVILLLAFGAVNFVSSMLLAVNRFTAFSALSNYAEYLAGIIILLTISKKDGNIRYAIGLSLILAFSMGILMVLKPVNFIENYTGRGTVYYTFSSRINPHAVATIQVLGIWAALIMQSYQKKSQLRHALFTIVLVLFCLFCIVMTNSRKGILSALLLLLIAFGPYLKLFYSKLRRINKVLILLAAAVLIAWIVADGRLLALFLTQNNLLDRLTTQMTGSSNRSRVALIIEALGVFVKNPVFGVGMNNMRYYSVYETYSHCTYSELLACCGIIGSLPLIAAVYYTGKPLFLHRYHRNLAIQESYRKSVTLAYFFVLVIVAVTQILFYDRGLMFAFSVILCYCCLLKENYQQVR